MGACRLGQFQATLTIGEHWEQLLGGLSRAEFCRLTQVNGESLSRWAKGIQPRHGTVCQVAMALGRDLAEIRQLLDAIVQAGRKA
jgi:transcriptional regulator with XRE-family HTH domain